jgi:hypothetical protein
MLNTSVNGRKITVGKGLLPPTTVSIAAAIFVFGGFGPNSLLAVLAIGILLSGAFLLWRPGESPILLFMFCFQWLQASIEIFQANWMGVDVNELGTYSGDDHLAILLTLLGLAALALGLRLGAGPWRDGDGMIVRRTASHYPTKFWFYLYCVAFVVAGIADALAFEFAGLSQPLLILASSKWAFYWMLAYASLLPYAPRRYLFCAFGVELALGMGGYFSDFKTVIFFTLIAMVAAGIRLRPRQYLLLVSLAVLAVLLGVVWTAVKIDYRSFISGGAKAQIVTVGYFERVAMLADLAGRLDGDAMVNASEVLLRRLAYVDFFGVVLDTVPAVRPLEGGAVWWDAIRRPFMPRFFFPDKTVIDDSVRTNYYTGLNLAGSEEGTSISIGYVGESYIDFGAPGMFVPIFGLGLLLGGFYRWMLERDRARLLGMALATMTIYGAAFLDSSITKLFGGLVVTMLVSWAILRIAPRYFPWVQSKMVH